MREIKFRAWDTVSKQMVNLDRLDITGDLAGWADDEDGTEYPFDAPVMQFTGLHDKTGKEIWEGDIVQGTHITDGKSIAPIIFEKGKFTTTLVDSTKSELVGRIDIENCEVLGNIHEHPDLLKP